MVGLSRLSNWLDSPHPQRSRIVLSTDSFLKPTKADPVDRCPEGHHRIESVSSLAVSALSMYFFGHIDPSELVEWG